LPGVQSVSSRQVHASRATLERIRRSLNPRATTRGATEPTHSNESNRDD
jgi:hypothetical protein